MNATIFAAIISRLNTSAALMALMGKTVGDNPCYRAQRLSAIIPPAITVHANTESSTLFPGVNAASIVSGAFLATNSGNVQIDVWVSSSGSSTPTTGGDTDAISNQIDILLLLDVANTIANTFGWRKVSSSQMYEDDTGLWHNALRYEFSYHVTSGYGLT